MIIRIAKRQDPYARIDKVPINDKQLTWKARGILCYLLSKPDDWQVIIQDLVNQSPQGETAVRGALKELSKAGYLVRETLRENGKITGVEYVVHERPKNTPSGENPDQEKPNPGKKVLLTNKEELTNKEDTKQDLLTSLSLQDKSVSTDLPEDGGKEKTEFDVKDELKFAELSYEEKCERLLSGNGDVKHSEKVGLLGDLLIGDKENAAEFLVETGGMKFVYPELARMMAGCNGQKPKPMQFLIDFLGGGLKIPFKEDSDWRHYLWGAMHNQYPLWCEDKAVAAHEERKKNFEPLEFIRQRIAGYDDDRWRNNVV